MTYDWAVLLSTPSLRYSLTVLYYDKKKLTTLQANPHKNRDFAFSFWRMSFYKNLFLWHFIRNCYFFGAQCAQSSPMLCLCPFLILFAIPFYWSYPPFWYRSSFTFSVSRSSRKIRLTLFRMITLSSNLWIRRYKYSSLILNPMIIRLNIVSTAPWQ